MLNLHNNNAVIRTHLKSNLLSSLEACAKLILICRVELVKQKIGVSSFNTDGNICNTYTIFKVFVAKCVAIYVY